ncbi:hypothetical protein QMK33_12910 [Hymenobacter sp. H14-R3]|uniref:hypothetical protein n=1 Tax=Hymenobacter sp. H14-R3 TaxID=3046308 RepID=UPI0024B9F508|nr:hypothetical protein [Hymenobacter sp. H14-R3]MDJ0366057.1 hypothetical protein [Hymenobacter sp. H14-R3]
MASLQIEIDYEQPLEILIEFPVAVLASYYGLSNLDEICDDNIFYLITNILLKNKVYIKRAHFLVEQKSEHSSGNISYKMFLVVRPPLFDFNWIIDALSKEGFQRGMHLKLASKNGIFESCYQDKISINY